MFKDGKRKRNWKKPLSFVRFFYKGKSNSNFLCSLSRVKRNGIPQLASRQKKLKKKSERPKRTEYILRRNQFPAQSVITLLCSYCSQQIVLFALRGRATNKPGDSSPVTFILLVRYTLSNYDVRHVGCFQPNFSVFHCFAASCCRCFAVILSLSPTESGKLIKELRYCNVMEEEQHTKKDTNLPRHLPNSL